VNKPLSGQAGIRGPYTNTGSRDAGPDPDYKPGLSRRLRFLPCVCAPFLYFKRRRVPPVSEQKCCPNTRRATSHAVVEDT